MQITHSKDTGLVFNFDQEDGLSEEAIKLIQQAAMNGVYGYSISSA